MEYQNQSWEIYYEIPKLFQQWVTKVKDRLVSFFFNSFCLFWMSLCFGKKCLKLMMISMTSNFWMLTWQWIFRFSLTLKMTFCREELEWLLQEKLQRGWIFHFSRIFWREVWIFPYKWRWFRRRKQRRGKKKLIKREDQKDFLHFLLGEGLVADAFVKRIFEFFYNFLNEFWGSWTVGTEWDLWEIINGLEISGSLL